MSLTGRRGQTTADSLALEDLADSLGLHVVAGFSFYKDPWLSSVFEDEDALTREFVEAATDGRAGTRYGVFGEIGTSLDEITPTEESQLRAAARAQQETGLAISTHCTLGTMALEQAAALDLAGADLDRVIIGHLDLEPDIDYLVRVIESGVNIAFDTFGKEWFDYSPPDAEGPEGQQVRHRYNRPDRDRIAALVELCEMGYAGRILLSCDMSGEEAWLNPETHGTHGYSYLPLVVIPQLREQGVPEDSIRQMLVGNPARVLAVP